MTGVIYARYSSDNQREESIEGQLRECKAFAKIENYPYRSLKWPPKVGYNFFGGHFSSDG